MTIATNNVHIYAAVPGQSIVIRSDESAVRGAFVISGSDCSISGIAFEDTNPTATGNRGYCIAASGDRFTISSCLFTSCRQAISVTGNHAIVSNNRIVAVSDTTRAIDLSGVATLASIRGNVIEDSGLTDAIYAGDNVSKSSFVANVCAASSAINYKNGQNNVHAGNVGTVTER
tara:strand:- start:342 stop:863 length:522 start_codon:yes stop_codon:yes gene_type:complete